MSSHRDHSKGLLLTAIGGLLLNIMPCVLPILAMKALAVAGHSGEHGRALREGLAYTAGAVLSFLVFGLVIVLLRQGGAAIGWGFQLQQPLAVAIIAGLLVQFPLVLLALPVLLCLATPQKTGSAGA